MRARRARCLSTTMGGARQPQRDVAPVTVLQRVGVDALHLRKPGNLAASLLSLHFFWRSRPLQRLPRQRKARRRHWSATA